MGLLHRRQKKKKISQSACAHLDSIQLLLGTDTQRFIDTRVDAYTS